MMYGADTEMGMVKECRRDWEADAKRIKKRIDTFNNLKSAIEDFMKEGHMHWFDEKEHRNSMLIAFGGLCIEIPVLEKEYDNILAEIEKGR